MRASSSRDASRSTKRLAIVLAWDCKNSTTFSGSKAARIVTLTKDATLLPENRPRASNVEREAFISGPRNVSKKPNSLFHPRVHTGLLDGCFTERNDCLGRRDGTLCKSLPEILQATLEIGSPFDQR